MQFKSRVLLVLRSPVFVIVAASLAVACAREPIPYETQFVTIERVVENRPGQLEFTYRTIAETMFHSPGVDLERRGDELEVRVLRTFYKDEGDPDVRAAADEPYLRSVDIDLQGARAVVLTDGAHRVELWRDGVAAPTQ
jgi:hypothetical protein